MEKFWIVVKYNVRFLFNNWMSKIFFVLITGVILLMSLYYNFELSKAEGNDVITVYTEDLQVKTILERYDEQIEIVSKNADVIIYKISESTFQISIKKDNIKESSINLVHTILYSVLNPKEYLIEIIKDYEETNSLFGIIISFLIYISVLFIGNIVITSVSLEKTSKMLDLISYKVSALMLVYGKCVSVLIYLFILEITCSIELFILDYFKVIKLDLIGDILNIGNLSGIEWGDRFVSVSSSTCVYAIIYHNRFIYCRFVTTSIVTTSNDIANICLL